MTNVNDAGPGSLRQAVLDADALPGADEITFDATVSGQTITLAGTELELTEALAIDASSLSEKVMIDANLQSRIFNISAGAGDFELAGLVLTRGNNFPRQKGMSSGAILSATTGLLSTNQSLLTGSIAASDSIDIVHSTPGGAIHSLRARPLPQAGEVTASVFRKTGSSKPHDLHAGQAACAIPSVHQNRNVSRELPPPMLMLRPGDPNP